MKKNNLPLLVAVGVLIIITLACGSTDSSGTPVPTPTFTVFDPLDFVTYPDNYKGAFVQVRGEVFNINSDKNLQMYLENSGDSIYITADEPYEKIYEGDTVIVTGYVRGEVCGKNAFGAEMCSPGINKAIVIKVD